MATPTGKASVDHPALPRYGARLLPQVVDQLAASDPTRVYASIPVSSDLSAGFRDVTILNMAAAVDSFAWWLESHIGRSSQFETLSYMGVSDIRYAIVFLAAVKCGYKLLLTSVRNSTWMNISLLEQTGCTKFLYSPEVAQKVRDLQTEKSDLQIFALPSLDRMLDGHSAPYPYEENFDDVRWNPILMLHSSGSTGPPKPITMNHGTFAVADNDRNLPTVEGRKNQNYALWNFSDSGGRYCSTFPPFHLGGFVSLVVIPIYSTAATVVLGPADRPPTGQTVSQIMNHYRLRAVFSPPSIFEHLVQEPEALQQVKHLEFLMYAGGPLSDTAGNLLSQLTDVCQFYGQTETGPAQALVPLRADWAYLEWHPLYDAHMEPSVNDAYEMVLYKNPRLQGIRSLSCNFPDVQEWHTNDLFRPHPIKPKLWQFHGRTDDIIVLSNGEKFNPVPSEAIVAGHSDLVAALIVGQARFQAALLVEPKYGVEPEFLVDRIWSTVEHANSQAPGHARITKSMIGVAKADKPFERAGKGTVIRKATAEKFVSEIESLYLGAIPRRQADGPSLTAKEDIEAIHDFVRACTNVSFPMSNVKNEDDLYVLGLDSLKTIEIIKVLKDGLVNSDTSWLTPQILYSHPTVSELSKTIGKHIIPHIAPAEGNHPYSNREIIMAQVVQDLTQDLPRMSFVPKTVHETSKLNVLLTGSTGSLGTYLLRALLNDPNVSRIYCLNRSANARQIQAESFARLNLGDGIESESVDFIKADYGHVNFGLPQAKLDGLSNIVDVIIHNAWKVDFNHSLESFAHAHLQGLRTLIDWSINSLRKPHICFISSISSVERWMSIYGNETLVPETPIASHEVAQQMGYAESKNIAEHILGVAKEKSQVPVSILRVGQIAGPLSTAGIWNRNEWFPSMVETSKSLQCLPNYIPDLDWIPVDKLATIVTEITRFAVTTDTSQTYNIVNPSPVPWLSQLDTVKKRLGPKTKVIELHEWIQMLERLDANDADVIRMHPAIKILNFYRGFESATVGAGKSGSQKYCTAHGTAASESMAGLDSICSSWMENWLNQWGY